MHNFPQSSVPDPAAQHPIYADKLTGLPNRGEFLAQLDTALVAPQPFAVLLLDCDRFKTINDSLGHPAGDQVLISIVERVQACLATSDVLARIDGDEFAILLANVANLGQALATAEHILRNLDDPFPVAEQEVFLSVSIGIVTSQTPYSAAVEALRDAETALHHAKEHGRGRYSVFDAQMHMRVVQRLKMETELRQALKQEELRVFYQPIIALENGMITGFEALVRWQHPDRDLLAPGEFLPTADELGLSIAVDRWVLRTAVRQMCQWIARFPALANLTLSVNMSGHHLEQADLLPFIRSVLQETGLLPRNLMLEITEEMLIRSRDTVITTLHRLRSMGIQISLDDFGTGYSSLSYLHDLPVNTLKVDRSFVSSMDVNPQVGVITNAIINLAHALAMDVVAEGVETIQHVNALRSSRCERAQGFFFSRPVDASRAEALLAQAHRQVIATSPMRAPERAVGQLLPVSAVRQMAPHAADAGQSPFAPSAEPASAAPPPAVARRVLEPADPALAAQHDALTGLLTRAALKPRLDAAVEQHRRTGEPFALAVIDLDHFKSINDAFGHACGDQVLTEFATRVRAATRSRDSIIRYGGDEFVLLLSNTNGEQARIFADRLFTLVGARKFCGEPPLALTISAGFAVFPADSENLAELFELADQRNYQAKRAGRGRAVLHDLPAPETVSLDGPSRLIERDEQLQVLHAFLHELTRHSRGILQIGGAAGNGITRFLVEAADAAHLRGYGVIALRGSLALKERVYGVLSNLGEPWRDLPLPAQGVQRFADSLNTLIRRKNVNGVVITLDNAAQTDPASLEFLQSLFKVAGTIKLALLYAPEGIDTTLHWPQEHMLRSQVDLAALSLQGLRTWIRHSLNWEMPEDILHWFYSQTGGRPALIRCGLQHLLEHEMLYPAVGGWGAWPDLTTVQINAQIKWQAAQPRHNLPIGQADFVGREADIAQIKAMLIPQRAIVVAGLGGTGKSRLAVQAAAEVADAFADGVCYVQLAPLNSAEFLMYTIADALGVSLVGAQSPREQILFHLSNKRLLLLLDNFEHLREETFFLQEIIERTAGVHLLITSRDRLVFNAATTLELAGLSLPDGELLADIEQASAAQLFVRRAQQTHSEFRLSTENAASVSRICRLVEGLPLGIELAAAWTRTFSCEAIAEKIELNLAFLEQGERGRSDRHRSLMAMIDSFWFMLSDHERSLLRQIAAFRGGFDGSAAREIIGASPFFLEGLVAKGYLRWTRNKRYEIHELLRQYAAEKLQALPAEAQQVADRHSRYYLGLVQRPDLQQFGSRHMLTEISINLENIRAAWQWAVQHGRLAILAQSVDGLEAFYDYKGTFHEAEALFGFAVTQLTASVAEFAEPDQLGNRLIGHVQAVQARFLTRCSRYDEAIAAAQSVLRQAEMLADAHLAALGAYHQGTALLNQGLYEAARHHLSQAADIARREQFVQLQADILRRLSRVAGQTGQYLEARGLGEQSLAICRQSGDRQRETRMLNDLGIIADSQGDYIASKSYYERCFQLCRELGDQPGEANVLLNLGAVAADQGEYTLAERYLEQALRVFREAGNLRDESIVLENLGDNARWQGDLDRATAYYEQALRICRKIGDRQGQSYLLGNLGLVSHQHGDDLQAYIFSRQALEIALAISDQQGQGRALTYMGLARHGAQALDEAEQYYQQAVQVFREAGQQHLTADPLAGLARLALEQSAGAAALQAIEPILHQLEYGSLDGNAEPLRIYLTCYQVLLFLDDPRCYAILKSALRLLQQRADRITLPEQRDGFLQQILAHKALLRAAKEHQLAVDPVLA